MTSTEIRPSDEEIAAASVTPHPRTDRAGRRARRSRSRPALARRSPPRPRRRARRCWRSRPSCGRTNSATARRGRPATACRRWRISLRSGPVASSSRARWWPWRVRWACRRGRCGFHPGHADRRALAGHHPRHARLAGAVAGRLGLGGLRAHAVVQAPPPPWRRSRPTTRRPPPRRPPDRHRRRLRPPEDEDGSPTPPAPTPPAESTPGPSTPPGNRGSGLVAGWPGAARGRRPGRSPRLLRQRRRAARLAEHADARAAALAAWDEVRDTVADLGAPGRRGPPATWPRRFGPGVAGRRDPRRPRTRTRGGAGALRPSEVYEGWRRGARRSGRDGRPPQAPRARTPSVRPRPGSLWAAVNASARGQRKPTVPALG